METKIRSMDCGGSKNYRRADIEDGKIVRVIKNSAIETIDQLLFFAGEDILVGTQAIVYSLAGVIEKDDLVVVSPNDHKLDGIYLGAATAKATGLPSAVYNDMETAVKGMAYLLPKGIKFLGITISSGIGIRYWNGLFIVCAAEAGHIQIDPSPFAPLCGCGKRGHVEAICSGHAIAGRVVDELAIRNLSLPADKEPCRFLDEAYTRGEEWAVDIYENIIAKGLGILFAALRSVYDFPLIVYKGTFGINIFQRGIERYIRAEMANALINPGWASRENLRIMETPGSDDHDALLGATQIWLATH